MKRLRIRNFGPLREGLIENEGWIDFSRVTVLVGNQGAGKSSVAKLFSTFSWIEKALVRGDYEKKWFERKNRLRNQFLTYHRLENYFELDPSDATEIDYEGDAYHISYRRGQLSMIEQKDKDYHLPQIMYVPAERNFIAYVRSPKELKLSSDSLKEFLTEFDGAKLSIKGPVELPLGAVELLYDRQNDILSIKDESYKLRLTDASSGFQSLVPLFLVSQHLSNTVVERSESDRNSMTADEVERFKKGVNTIFSNMSLTEEQKRVALSVLSSRFNKTAFINIVEEPEQNLFPTSQWSILKSLLGFNNRTDNNTLVLTTHSPYIVNYLSLAIQAKNLSEKILLQHGQNSPLLKKLEDIVEPQARVQGSDVAVYQLDDHEGTISRLPVFDGIPSDRNYLNDTLRKGNQLFDKLLELESEL